MFRHNHRGWGRVVHEPTGFFMGGHSTFAPPFRGVKGGVGVFIAFYRSVSKKFKLNSEPIGALP